MLRITPVSSPAALQHRLLMRHGLSTYSVPTALQSSTTIPPKTCELVRLAPPSHTRQQRRELARPSQVAAVEPPVNPAWLTQRGLGATHPRQSQGCRHHVPPAQTGSCSECHQEGDGHLLSKGPQDTLSEPSPLGHWDLLRTLPQAPREPSPGSSAPNRTLSRPAGGTLTSSSQRSCLRRLAMSSGVSPDSLAKRRGDEQTCYGKSKQRSDTERQLKRDPVKQHQTEPSTTNEIQLVCPSRC